MQPPIGDDWLGISEHELPVVEALAWAIRPGCGGQVVFTGTVRDNAEGRDDVTAVTYEAYDEQVVPRLAAIAVEARRRWPDLGPIALLHRTGRLVVGEISVAVIVAAPHRDEAFLAARFAIDTLKETVPVWKDEEWSGGRGWGTNAMPVSEVPS